MKLKVLEIHNIASIEDATIDFSGEILGAQDLFLICGPTGSGKSTILDAICLALFNKTPRIERSPGEKLDSFDEDSASVYSVNKLNNTLHLVRKNAVEAHVILTFEADGRDYTASWRVSRSGQFRKGQVAKTFQSLSLQQKLQKKMSLEWTLTDDQGQMHAKEVEKRIGEIIKMSYEQFCKTTMLAQGDFTKFLCSKSDEKAQILERLVGTEQYARVGSVINRMTNEKRNEAELLRKELEGITFLSDDQRAEKQAEIKAADEQIAHLSALKKVVDDKLRLIEQYSKAVADEKKSLLGVQNAESALNTDDVRQQRHVINLWDLTTAVREAIVVNRKCERAAVNNNVTEQRLLTEYDAAINGLQYIINRHEKLLTDNNYLAEVIRLQKPFESMFGNADLICSKHNTIEKNKALIAENTEKLQGLESNIQRISVNIKQLEVDKAKHEQQIKALEEQSAGLKEQLKLLNADNIDSEVTELNKRKSQLQHTYSLMQQRDKALTDRSARLEDVKKATSYCEQTDAAQKRAMDTAEDAEKVAKQSLEIYNKALLSIDDSVTTLRAKLTAGDKCPVCGNVVVQILDEANLKAALLPLEQKCNADKETAHQANKSYTEAKAQALAAYDALMLAQKQEKQAVADLEQYNQLLTQNCIKLGIGDITEVVQELDKIAGEIEAKETAIKTRQDKIREVRRSLQEIVDKCTDIRNKEIAPIDKKLSKLRDDIDAKNRSKAQVSGTINTAKEAIAGDEVELHALINPDWKPRDSKHYYQELKEAAEGYTDMLKRFADNETAIKALSQEINNIEHCRLEIAKLFPAWAERSATVAAEMPDIVSVWTRLNRDAGILATSIENITRDLKEAKNVINQFAADNPHIEMTEVERLTHFTDTYILQMRNHIADLVNTHSSAKALHQEALNRKLELEKSLPSEEETKDTLQAEAQSLSDKSREYSEAKGRLQNELYNDDNNRIRQGQKKAELDALNTEWEQWEYLNKYLGNTNGKNFRNVAQSFILADLLAKANTYLQNISTRYTLFCHPGTLTIMMRDAYQGGIDRTTNTLSGGESFIISLSLALGLSSMQNCDFEVDTLFIDEGFGTLSPEYLDPVIYALKRLHQVYGRRVGIISHVDTLKQRISTSIEVSKTGTSSSQITIKHN